MKKITLLTGAVIACTFSFAQIGKGSLMLGGSFSFGTNKYSSTQTTSNSESKSGSVIIAPSFGYAIRQNLFIGVGGSYNSYEYTSFINTTPQQETTGTGWSTFVFLRKYATLGKGFYLFAEPAAYYYKRNEQQIPGSNQLFGRESKTSALGLSLYPGVAYAVNRKLHLEVGLNRLVDINYNRLKEFTTQNGGQTLDGRTVNGFNLITNLNTAAALSVGARFLFAK